MAAWMGIGLGVPLESDNPALVEAIFEIRDVCVRNGAAPCRASQADWGANRHAPPQPASPKPVACGLSESAASMNAPAGAANRQRRFPGGRS